MCTKNFFAVASALLLAACRGGDAPQVPTTLQASAGSSIVASAGTLATVIPTVTLNDANGRGIANVYVHFVATGGGKPVNDSSKTNSSGLATSGGWTLGTGAGTQLLTATASGFSVTFTAQVGAGAVSSLVRLTTDPQTGVVGTTVASPPSVRAVDQYGNPVAGVVVTFSVINNAGTITGSTKTTDVNGLATADAWIIGPVAGQQLARATATGVSVPAIFSVSSVAAAPAKIGLVSGNNGTGVTGASLASFATLPTVRVTDAFDNPIAGVTVVFTPGPNSGSVTGGTVVTNDGGLATVGGWTLGTAVSQTLIATSPAIPALQVFFTATASITQFNITVRYVGDLPSARQQLAVTRAVDKWRSIIVSNSGTSFVALPAGSCGRTWLPAISESVTNVLIFAQIGPIDGVGNVLGNGNTCTTHAASGLTSVGTILFDSADLGVYEASGLIDVIVLHEMGHVLGFGTLWNSHGVTSGIGGSDPIFTGSAAINQFNLLASGYSGRPVPLENCVGINQSCGGGTRDVHWRELVFRNELMTGYLNTGVNPLSRVTVASMQDIGYAVVFAGADPFSIQSSLAVSPFAQTIHLGNDVLDTDIYSFDGQGRRTTVKKKGSN